MRNLAIASSILLFATSPFAQTGSTPTPSSDSIARLPVTRVILYKNGIGYFEHAGHVRGNQQVNVDFTTAQLNDVLKSLTILDLGKGRVTGVSYNSVAPLSRQLEALRLPIGEDWSNVELSLVAGAPQSFVQELSQPYYTRRPVVPLPENAMITPQTHEATLEETATAPSVMSGASGVVGGVPGGVAGGVIGGIMGVNGAVGSGMGAGVGAGGGGLYRGETIANIMESATTVAESKELGDLFKYKIRDHVTIRKNQSALVPILQARIDAEKVSVWNPSGSYVLRALWATNNSDLTLDGGSFNILEGDAFAGEGLMDPIKPGEKRLLSYAADLGLVVDAKDKAEQQRVTQIVISRGAMIQKRQDRLERTYTIHNRDTSPRTVVIEHPAREGWKLADGVEPEETTASLHRFRLKVEPKKTSTLTVSEFWPVSTRWELKNLSDKE